MCSTAGDSAPGVTGSNTPSPRNALMFGMRSRLDADGDSRMIGSGRRPLPDGLLGGRSACLLDSAPAEAEDVGAAPGTALRGGWRQVRPPEPGLLPESLLQEHPWRQAWRREVRQEVGAPAR